MINSLIHNSSVLYQFKTMRVFTQIPRKKLRVISHNRVKYKNKFFDDEEKIIQK